MSLLERAEQEFQAQNFEQAKDLLLEITKRQSWNLVESFSKAEINTAFQKLIFIFQCNIDQPNLRKAYLEYLEFLEFSNLYSDLEKTCRSLIEVERNILSKLSLLYKLVDCYGKLGQLSKKKKAIFLYLEEASLKRATVLGIGMILNSTQDKKMDSDLYIHLLKYYIWQNNTEKLIEVLEEICTRFISRGELKTGVSKSQFIQGIVNLLLIEKTSLFPSPWIVYYLLELYIHKVVNYTEKEEKKRQEYIVILGIFRELVAISPTFSRCYCLLTEFFLKINSPQSSKTVLNFIQREFASEALKEGSELNEFIKYIEDKLQRELKIDDLTIQNNLEDKTVILDELELDLLKENHLLANYKEIGTKELGIKRLNKALTEKRSLDALEIAINLSSQYFDDPYLMKLKRNLLELDIKSIPTITSLTDNQSVYNQKNKRRDAISIKETQVWEKEIIHRLSDPTDELFETPRDDLILMFISLGLYQASLAVINLSPEVNSSTRGGTVQLLAKKYLEISTYIAMENYHEALILVELINNTVPLVDDEKVCFLYLEAELLFLLKKYAQAKALFKEVKKINPNYRLVNERIEEIA